MFAFSLTNIFGMDSPIFYLADNLTTPF